MKIMDEYLNPNTINISIEEFDQLEGEHDFSPKYQKNKKNMLKKYRKNKITCSRTMFTKIAAAAVVVLVGTPFVVNAATNGELYNRIWGNLGRADIASHDETVYDEDKNTTYTVTYPERDYEPVDEEKAQELVGENISFTPIVQEIDGTILTIKSAVRDGNAAVVEFTLEKEGGVDALNYSQLDNEAKGAWFSDEATFWFQFIDANENIYVDLDKSTKDILYCYDYMTLKSGLQELNLEIQEYPCTRGETMNADSMQLEEIESKTTVSNVSVPIGEKVSSVKYINLNGGSVEISPLSIKVDMKNGLGLTNGEECDPWNCYYIAINYKDGTSYVVIEHEKSGIYDCETEIDNTSYACGDLDGNFTCVFNRLVDTNNIESITVNDSTYNLDK